MEKTTFIPPSPLCFKVLAFFVRCYDKLAFEFDAHNRMIQFSQSFKIHSKWVKSIKIQRLRSSAEQLMDHNIPIIIWDYKLLFIHKINLSKMHFSIHTAGYWVIIQSLKYGLLKKTNKSPLLKSAATLKSVLLLIASKALFNYLLFITQVDDRSQRYALSYFRRSEGQKNVLDCSPPLLYGK